MNRILPVILLLPLLLLNPYRGFADAPLTEPPPPLPQEETAPVIPPLISNTRSTRNDEFPSIVAEQRDTAQEEPASGQTDRQSDLVAEGKEEEMAQIPDPLRPWNNAIFQINDKLYFWLLKPVATGYSYVVLEPIRTLFYNFFDNLRAPARIVNNLLQGKLKGAGDESIRFLFNSTAGLGGLADAAKELLHIQRTSVDFGQTLGRCGIGQGFYVVWPIIGPSSPRDTVGWVVDRFMCPLSYISFTNISFAAASGITGFEIVNDTSLHIGDYESFKRAAIDPYISMRDAYVQNRKKAIEK